MSLKGCDYCLLGVRSSYPFMEARQAFMATCQADSQFEGQTDVDDIVAVDAFPKVVDEDVCCPVA